MNEVDRQYWCYVDGKRTDVKPLDELVRGIKAHIESVERRNRYLEEQNKELKDEHYKDNTIADIKKQLDEAKEDLHRGFSISKKEQEKIDTWMQEHEEKKHGANYSKGKYRKSGAIGGSYTYEFTPTSIGTFGTIKCSCGECFDFQKL